ncbi:hypothetical protein ACS0TY_022211 [Phlomoides rotata]
MASSRPIVIREVWGSNLDDEINLLHQSIREFPIASFDTEFPGSIYTTGVRYSKLSPSQLYWLMKQNVDSLKLIQLGITLSDAHGNLPSFGTEFQYVWQFNFDFDPDCDPHDPEAITFLESHGMDFEKNRNMGIDSHTFASKFVEYGLTRLSWVTFDGLYDYGYLIKILTGKQLPCDLEDFMMLKQAYFGFDDYDTKDMANELGLYGGLEKMAKNLKLDRVVGRSHQAGSDSLLTMHLFLQLIQNFVIVPVLMVNKFNIMYPGNRLCPIPFHLI